MESPLTDLPDRESVVTADQSDSIRVPVTTSQQPRSRLSWQANRWILTACIALGCLALVYYFSWWWDGWLLRWPVLALLLPFAMLYAGMQMVGNWILYLVAHFPTTELPIPQDLTVDVFITATDEPYELVEASLSAACNMHGAHSTWLLDDNPSMAKAALAKRLGAGYLTRTGRQHAKAGNLNAALSRTNGDIIVIFDIDHVPSVDFLEKTLGYFSDPSIGFAQVMLTFSNRDQSWVAAAASETSLDYYNPTSRGASGIGGATMMGSNALIRRKALESIGGYKPGLAEDLATSIALHGAGWRSIYIASPLAPGIAPPDLPAWFTQQLKWARGVFEILLTSFPRLITKLTWGQRISYAVRMTKYWIGPVVGFHLIATIAVLIWGDPLVREAFHEYLIRITPLAFCDVLIRFVALRTWQHASIPKSNLLRAITLVYATWPIYLTALWLAFLRVPLLYQPTPKQASHILHPAWLLPQILAVLFLAGGILYTVVIKEHPPSLLLLFALIQGLLQLILLAQWMLASRRWRQA